MGSPQEGFAPECNTQNATVPHRMVKKLPSDLLIFSLSTFTNPAARQGKNSPTAQVEAH